MRSTLPHPTAAALAAALLLGAAAAQAQPLDVRVVHAQGDVRIDGAPARAGMAAAGTRVQTGPEGRVQLRSSGGALIALPPASELRIAADRNALTLASGGVRLHAAGAEWRVDLPERSVRTNGFLQLQDCAAGCALPTGVYGRIAGGDAVLEYPGGRSVLRNRSFRWPAANARPEVLALQPPILADDSASRGDAARVRTEVAAQLKTGIEAFARDDHAAATAALERVRALAPGETLVAYYLGLIALNRQDNDAALAHLQQYAREDPEGAAQRDVPKTLTLLSSAQLQQEVASAVAREQEVVSQPPEPGSIAVQAFVNRGNDAYRAMAKGLAAMTIADLSKVPSLKVLEREKVQLLVNEARLGDSGLADTASAVRSGRLMRAEKVVVGNFEASAGPAGAAAPAPAADTAPPAQTFALEGAVIDSRSAQNLGVVSERGDIAAVFRAQKALTFGILRSAGIPVEQLPPDIRARVERFATTNVEAFRAFSQGLDLKDQGRFAEAREQFRRAAQLDPGFALAAEQQQAMPDVNLTAGVQTRAVLAAAAGAAVDRGKAAFAVDVARATAALAAGATVIALPASSEQARALAGASNADFTTNPPGSGSQFAPNLVVGLSYPNTATIQVASSNEYAGGNYRAGQGVLDAAGTADGFFAQRGGAAVANRGNHTLADGTVAYWGSWLSTPGSTASVTIPASGGNPAVRIEAPVLGQVDYVMADATRQMPSAGTAVFTPVASTTGAMFTNPSGSIAVNFVTRDVTLNNLGFGIGNLAFSGLQGSARYDEQIASGFFRGNYSAGSCTGCAAFNPVSSAFGGNFVGRAANGLVFSTILVTGDPARPTVGGTQLFEKP
jgi:tetratricopeptide (TPR) repeat protein